MDDFYDRFFKFLSFHYYKICVGSRPKNTFIVIWKFIKKEVSFDHFVESFFLLLFMAKTIQLAYAEETDTC